MADCRVTGASLGLLNEDALVVPHRLRAGDRVGVFSPSLPLAARYPLRFERGLAALAAALDVKVVATGQSRLATGFTAGDARSRAGALSALVEDAGITAIFCANGGFNSAEILPFLSPALLQGRPKVLVGYSDATALLLGVQALSGWVTYHGPAVMPQMGEFPAPFAFTLDELRAQIVGANHQRTLDDPPAWTQEFLDWGSGAWLARPRRLCTPARREVWREGRGRGRLFGGNLETLNMLIGTPYCRPPADLILFWEAHAEEAHLPRLRRALTHLRQSGILERTRGMLVGRSPAATPVAGVSLCEMVLDIVADDDFPVVGELAFGHTDPVLTLPVGMWLEIEATGTAARLQLQGA